MKCYYGIQIKLRFRTWYSILIIIGHGHYSLSPYLNKSWECIQILDMFGRGNKSWSIILTN